MTSPEGYATWLDSAVETFDTRRLLVESLLSDDHPGQDQTAIREAARRELLELRSAAARRIG